MKGFGQLKKRKKRTRVEVKNGGNVGLEFNRLCRNTRVLGEIQLNSADVYVGSWDNQFMNVGPSV